MHAPTRSTSRVTQSSRRLVLALTLVALLLTTVLTGSTGASEATPGRQPFAVQTEGETTALLLPAVQMAREAAR